jgi:hypothetical protein
MIDPIFTAGTRAQYPQVPSGTELLDGAYAGTAGHAGYPGQRVQAGPCRLRVAVHVPTNGEANSEIASGKLSVSD